MTQSDQAVTQAATGVKHQRTIWQCCRHCQLTQGMSRCWKQWGVPPSVQGVDQQKQRQPKPARRVVASANGQSWSSVRKLVLSKRTSATQNRKLRNMEARFPFGQRLATRMSLSTSPLSSSSEPNWMLTSPISSIRPALLTRFFIRTSTAAASMAWACTKWISCWTRPTPVRSR